jgi:hypothetical protein
MDEIQNVENPFSLDRKNNSDRLLSTPGLINRYSMVVGNQIFYPPGDYAVGEMNHTKVNVDGRDMVIHTFKEEIPKDAKKTDAGTKLVEAVNFTYEAMHSFFRGNIPVEFKQSIYLLAVYRKDPAILEVGFSGNELLMLQQDASKKIG